uniref:Uncharacterized protein n=1 Tax=Anopheles farauti TaxID=69004 RepID=A0A182Q783_9DIPT
MHTEAILLTLVGLISTGLTSPLVGKQPAKLEALNVSMTESNASNASQTAQETNMQRLQSYCKPLAEDSGCLAYNEMIDLVERNKLTDVESTIGKELGKKMTKTEVDEFCMDLSQMIKKLPPSLVTKTLLPFRSILECVGPCYTLQRELKDICRALYIGYNTIEQAVVKKELKNQPPVKVQEVQKQVSDDKNQSIVAKIVPAVANLQAANVASKEESAIPPPKDANQEVNLVPENPVANNVHAQSSDDVTAAKKPVPAESDTGSKLIQKPDNESASKPGAKLPQEAPPEKNDPDLEQQQQGGSLDGIGGDVAPFDDEPKQALDPEGKDPTLPVFDNSDESEAMTSAEDGNDDDPEVNGFQPVGKVETGAETQPKLSQSDDFPSSQAKASDIVQGTDPFYEQKDSNFFSYFLFAMFSCAMLYVAYHNKSKLLALVVEGRRTSSGRGGFSKGRKHTAAYRKLDSNLEEAITSGSTVGGHSSSQIIY